jgi:hypothetical protein
MEKESITIDLSDVREVTPQELSECGFNPYAVQIISESFIMHPNPKPVTFKYKGAIFHMRPVK